ncbi:LPS-assembly protein LptD [Parvularcula flava]|uniref:LPS-assembly protein LptD n=1 Tax=Aquisalinus luteolus TaxID=1566827 RepID=A0A8J3A5P9_9PROT|nr:LPS assembly protein LptD [Aquisalinus luteolus]NHK27415.1 LPS-assembly protein LptD [Aquisalinus luteolus]GGH95372.1 LPS-assembly protein LptD [Aquisalinus luteolus]
MQISRKALLAGLAGGMAITAVSHAQLAPSGEEERVVFEADIVTRQSTDSPVIAEGNVKAYYGERFITSDRIVYDPATDIVTAIGNVAITEADGQTYFADDLVLTGDMADGVVNNFSALLEDDSRLASATLVKEGDQRNILNRAVYTGCDVCKEDGSPKTPSWQVKALKVVQDKEEQVIRFRNAFFEVKGVPILYTPYMQIPDPSVKRQSGLLAPSFGSTTTQGAYLEIPYYWAISDYQDFTFSPKFMEDQGVLLQGEYRINNWRGGTTMQAGIINANEDSEYFISGRASGNTPGTRFHFFGKGYQNYAENWRASYDASYVSDKRYLRTYDISRRGELAKDAELFRPDRLNSEFKLQRRTDTSLFAVEGLAFQSLRNNEDNSYAAQGLPRIRYDGVFDTPGIGGQTTLSGQFLSLYRENGLDSYMTNVSADWERRFTTSNGHLFRVFGELRGDIHNYQDLEAGNEVCNMTNLSLAAYQQCIDTFPIPEDEDGTTVGRFLPTAGVEWSYPLAKQTSNATYIIEPRVQLIASPEADYIDEILNEDSQYYEFDTTTLFTENKSAGYDIWEDGQRANIGLSAAAVFNNGLSVNGEIGQQFRSEESSVYSAYGLQTGLGDTQSDIVGSFGVSWKNYINLDNSFRLDKDDGTVRRAETQLSGAYWRFSGSASYLKVQQPDLTGLNQEEEFVNAALTYNVTDQWAVSASAIRDITADENTREQLALIYSDECTRIILAYRNDPRRDLGFDFDKSISIKVELLGISN